MADDVYGTLNENAREIRLMTLLPGNPEDEIQATLGPISLDAVENEYEALSYAWGDPTNTRSIKISGESFAVTENLEAALRRLRFPDRDRVLWIDAICVNQVNISERNSQVHHMRDVYSKCSRCVIWLGEEDETTAEGVRFLRFAATDSHLREWPRFKEMAGPDEADEDITKSVLKVLEQDPHCFDPFRRLMMRSWWYRMWTVQEFVLPKSVLIVCGSFIIDWDIVVKAQETMLSHYDACCAAHYKALNGDSLEFAAFWTITIVLQLFRRERRENDLKNYDLLDFLRSFRGRLATDPRDKVYGILGLVSLGHHIDIIPSYESDTYAAYVQTIQHDIYKTGTLNMLGHVEDREESGNTYHLPSWAPDWSKTITWFDNQAPRILRTTMGLYKACGDTNFTGSFPSDNILSSRGIRHGTIAHVGRLIGGEASFATALEMRDWLTSHLPPDARLDDAIFQRVLLYDSYIEQSAFSLVLRATEQHYADCRLWWETQSNMRGLRGLEKEKWKAFVNVETTVSTNLLLRKFFVTEKGEIGIGPPKCREGDEVWVLSGGKVPLVLRRAMSEEGKCETQIEEPEMTELENGMRANHIERKEPEIDKSEKNETDKREVADREYHILVGEAFVDGIMDGEAAVGLGSPETSTEVFLK